MAMTAGRCGGSGIRPVSGAVGGRASSFVAVGAEVSGAGICAPAVCPPIAWFGSGHGPLAAGLLEVGLLAAGCVAGPDAFEGGMSEVASEATLPMDDGALLSFVVALASTTGVAGCEEALSVPAPVFARGVPIEAVVVGASSGLGEAITGCATYVRMKLVMVHSMTGTIMTTATRIAIRRNTGPYE